MRMPSQTAVFSVVCSAILTSSLIPSGSSANLASAGAPAVQAAVQSVLNGMHTQGFAGDLSLPRFSQTDTPPAISPALNAETNSQSGAGSTLTAEFMVKMLQLLTANGVDRDMPASFAAPLGLATNGNTWANRQVGAKVLSNGLHRSFSVSRGADQDIALSVLRPDAILAFRARRDGTLVAAVRADRTTGAFTVRDNTEAQADFAAECAWWMANVDDLIAGK